MDAVHHNVLQLFSVSALEPLSVFEPGIAPQNLFRLFLLFY